MLDSWALTGLKFGLSHVSKTDSKICRTWGKNAWRPSDLMSKHLKIINQTNTLLNKIGPFHLSWAQSSGRPSVDLDCWGCISHWNVVVQGESQPTGQPNPSSQIRPCPKSGPLCRHPNSLSTPPANGSSLATTQAREVTTCKVDCPDSEGLLEGPGRL